MDNMKKRSDAVMDSPLRTPSGSGTGASEDASATTLRSENRSKEVGNMKTFRCADVGPKECRWETSGRNEEELMPRIERHGREAHNMQEIDDNMRKRIRSNIRDIAA